MNGESAPSSEDTIKAINDKLSELQDLQLVNKLDIINIKNELDRLSLSHPSADVAEKISELSELADKSDFKKKFDSLKADMDRLRAELGGRKPSDTGLLKSEIDALKGRIKGARPAPYVEPKELKDLRGEQRDLREKIQKLEKKISERVGAAEAGAAKPDIDVPEIRKELEEIGRKVDEKGIPEDIMQRIDEMEAISKKLEKEKERISRLEDKVGKGAEPSGVPEDVIKRIQELEERSEALGEEMKRVSELEEKVKSAGKAGTSDVGGIEEGLNNLKSLVEDQGKEITEIQASKLGKIDIMSGQIDEVKSEIDKLGKDIKDKNVLQLLESVDTISKEIRAMKARVMGVEEKAARIGLAPEALKELKNLKGKFPVEDMTVLKRKMASMEANLQKLGKLAAGLKPIELPGAEDEEAEMLKELKLRINSLEKLVGEGIGEDRFRRLEEKMEDLKSDLPEHVSADTKKKLGEIERKLDNKMVELEGIKNQIIESAIEQLLAKPSTLSKFMDERVRKLVDEMEKKVGGLDTDVRSLNSKVTGLTSTVKAVEDAGVKEVLRDLEILKTKADWLESTVSKLNLKQLSERIAELESRSSSPHAGGYSPIIIE